MLKDFDPKWKSPVAPTAGQVRPEDLKQSTQRQQNNQNLRQQAQSADIPMRGETQNRPTAQWQLPQQMSQVKQMQAQPGSIPTTASRPVTPETPLQNASTSQAPAADRAAQEETLMAGRTASNMLNILTQGGAKTPATPQAPASPAAHLQATLIANFSGLKVQPQATGKNTKTALDARPQPKSQTKNDTGVKGKVRQPGDSVGDTTTDAQVAEQVLQENPFVAQQPSRQAGAERSATKDDIKSDRRASARLESVTAGVARGIIAASGTHEFSGGSYSGGFGDPNDGSPGLAHKVSTAPQIPVYGESADYVETEALYAGLGLSQVIHGKEGALERVRVSIGDRILNTQDDVPLSKRFGDEGFLQQAAYGARTMVYGKGLIG